MTAKITKEEKIKTKKAKNPILNNKEMINVFPMLRPVIWIISLNYRLKIAKNLLKVFLNSQKKT